MKAILTVLGKDKSGIIAEVSTMLAKNNVNIEDISQTIMQGCFTMIMLIDLENAKVNFQQLVEESNALGEKIDVKIILQHQDIFDVMHKI